MVIYLDDLIIFKRTFEEHLERIDLVFTRLKECALKLAAEKCFFFKNRLSFLGHVVSEEGIETDPAKIEKIRNWPRSKTPDEPYSFLAFTGYYRRFIKDFSKVTKPLSELIPHPTGKTDAFTQGLEAVLYQEQDNHKKVIAYASRALSNSEKKSAYKLEFLALNRAILYLLTYV